MTEALTELVSLTELVVYQTVSSWLTLLTGKKNGQHYRRSWTTLNFSAIDFMILSYLLFLDLLISVRTLWLRDDDHEHNASMLLTFWFILGPL